MSYHIVHHIQGCCKTWFLHFGPEYHSDVAVLLIHGSGSMQSGVCPSSNMMNCSMDQLSALLLIATMTPIRHNKAQPCGMQGTSLQGTQASPFHLMLQANQQVAEIAVSHCN